jgi:hypothetical protein
MAELGGHSNFATMAGLASEAARLMAKVSIQPPPMMPVILLMIASQYNLSKDGPKSLLEKGIGRLNKDPVPQRDHNRKHNTLK